MPYGEYLWIGALLVAYLVLKYRPHWVQSVVVAVAGKAIGRAALNQQPDFITPMPSSEGPARPEAKSAIESLTRRGFVLGGSYVIPEMGGMPFHTLAKPEESVVAIVYEHPKAGVWCDVSTRYVNGTSYTVSNAKLGGALEPRPGHTMIRDPGLTTAALHLRLMRDRPPGTPITLRADRVADALAEAYAEETAWRKGKGITKEEVAAVARETA